VKSLRTVALLAIFSQDSTTVSNIQSCLKSMSVMEPDLILHPILERAVPSLEALVEVSLKVFTVDSFFTQLTDTENDCCHQSSRRNRPSHCVA
jgi:hypothetical protein